MSATTHAIAAYAVTVLLLWGYALSLWVSCRGRRGAGKSGNTEAGRKLS